MATPVPIPTGPFTGPNYGIATNVRMKTDPVKKEIFDAIGDLSKLDRLFSARILIAIYIQPRKTKGGIILTDKELMEDVWQGTVGLVLKKGPRAFVDDEDAGSKFYGQNVEIGDWVTFRPGDGKRTQINGVNCRIMEDTQIDGVTTDPTLITHRQTDVRVR